MKNSVTFYYENETETEIDTLILENMKKTAIAVVDSEFSGKSFDVSVTLVNNETIKQLNFEHRGKDTPTDVLSFPLDEFESAGATIPLGDIVISVERAEEQAAEYGHGLMREMCFLTAHSMLHLLGYDHENSEEERTSMEEKQESILNSLGITRG